MSHRGSRPRCAVGRPGSITCPRFQSFDRLLDLPGVGSTPDLFVYLGDIHYGNTDRHEDLRWNYRVTRKDRSLLHARVPTLAVWDDHDFGGNNADSTNTDSEESHRVFSEYFINPPRDRGGAGIHFRHRYGDVEFFGLDTRFYRPRPVTGQ